MVLACGADLHAWCTPGRLNVTGELGAYYIGAWSLWRGGEGSFRGVTLQSQGSPYNKFLPTLDVQVVE